MNFKEIDAYLLSKERATFDYPFDEVVRVYRLADKMLRELIDHSYELIYDKLPKKKKALLNQ